MDLYIDTTKPNQTIIKIIEKDGSSAFSQAFQGVGSETLIPHLDKIFEKFPMKKIGRIFVNSGPGSFTGTRVGVSVANALVFSLKIPVNNLKVGSYAKVKYEDSKYSK